MIYEVIYEDEEVIGVTDNEDKAYDMMTNHALSIQDELGDTVPKYVVQEREGLIQ